MQIQAQQHKVEMSQFAVQAKVEADKRRLQWEFEKFHIAEQNDFLMYEKVRMDKIQADENKRIAEDMDRDSKIKWIQENENWSENDKKRGIAKLMVGFSPPKADPYAQAMEDIMSGEDAGASISMLDAQRAAQDRGKVLMVEVATGQPGEVERSEVEEYLKSGEYKLPGTSYEEQVTEDQRKAQVREGELQRGSMFGYPAAASDDFVSGVGGKAKKVLDKRYEISVRSPQGKVEKIDSRELKKYQEKGYVPVSVNRPEMGFFY